ncbi:DUF5305 family protein [Thermococcus gorgonarius]|uniref:Uncharacterized protein n=1 Tax=Thermococcus gorgonarius TaxID=71997 RepID=A0A2Z2M9R3_THEGO|nr:DUF5305 family protein [Thermococcus gorgonarius]ASJ01215.1 hypothetical protein A3K92_06830 [Thermococcus gorgonarius]
MKRIHIERKNLIKAMVVASLGMALFFGAYSLAAYSRQPSTVRATYKTLYTEKAGMSNSGFFSGGIYKNGTSLNYYPEKITSLIRGNYTYTTSPGAAGSYKATLRADYYVTSGKKRIYLINTTLDSWSDSFTGSFSIPVTFNVLALEDDLADVRSGTGLYRASGDTYLDVQVNVPGREPFKQRIDLERDSSGMLFFTGLTKDYTKVVRNVDETPNHIGVGWEDVSVSTARKVFPAMAFLFFLPPLGFFYGRRERKPKDELSNLRKFIVEGTPKDGGKSDPVELKSVGDLEKVFDLVDRPVVHHVEGDYDVYAIVDGDVTYEYRRKKAS